MTIETPPSEEAAPAQEESQSQSAPVPLTFWQDLIRAVQGRKPPLDEDGRPPVQPWATRPGRIIAMVTGIAGVVLALLFPPLGLGLGLLGFVLANTAWAHLRRGDPARPLTVVGQVLNAVAVLLGVVGIVLGLVFGQTGSTGMPAAQPSEQQAVVLTAEPAVGLELAGTGDSFSVPEGWAVPADVTIDGADLLAADLTGTDDFASSVNVMLSPARNVTSSRVESSGADELEDGGATDVTVRDRVMVDGAEAAHLSAGFSASGTRYNVDQYYTTHDGQLFVVTFAFGRTVPVAARERLAESVLASWLWA